MSYVKFSSQSAKNMRTTTGYSVQQTISLATKELKECIGAEIDAFYASYEPVEYKRTKALRDVFKNAVAKGITYDYVAGLVTFNIDYNLNKAAHKSWDGGKADVVKLLNYGYTTKKKPKRLPYSRKGFFFIENAVEKFNAQNKYGVRASAEPFKNARNDYRL